MVYAILGSIGRARPKKGETMPTEELKEQLTHVESSSTVRDGKLVGEYDFYDYLAAFEGKEVHWSLELVEKH